MFRRPFVFAGACALLFALTAPLLVAREHEDRGGFDRWFMRGRRSHDGTSPAAHRQAALRKPRRRPGPAGNLVAASAPVGGAWTELGPAPINSWFSGAVSGRISALALDLVHSPSGNVLYVGGAFGGVWKTSNAQAPAPVYTPLSDGLQSLAVGSIALDSSVSPPIIYVGSGEANGSADSYYGVGIFKSSDDGATWSLASSADGGSHPFQGLFISDIKVDPINPAVILAAAGRSDMSYWGPTPGERGIFRSSDAGATWSLVSNPGHGVTSLAYDPSRSTYYAAASAVGLLKSTNQGLSWTAMASPFPSGASTAVNNLLRPTLAVRGGVLYCLAVDSGSLYAPDPPTDSALSQSGDGGLTWTKIATGGITPGTDDTQADYDVFLGAPAGASGLVMGLLDVFTSAGSGSSATWTNRTHVYSGGTVHPDQHAFAAVDAGHWFIGNDGGVWRTADSGSTWVNLNTNLGLTQFTSVSPDPFHAGSYLGASQDNGSERTSGAQAWDQDLDGDGGYTAIDPENNGRWYTERDGIDLWRSSNSGGTFSQQVVNATVITDAAEFYAPYLLVPGQPGTMLYGAERIWRGPSSPSTPGLGWVPISPHLGDPVSGLDVCAAANNVAYAVTDGATQSSRVLRSADVLTAATWVDVTGATLPASHIFSCVAVNPKDPANACVGVQSFGTGHVYMTTDSGANWGDISGNLPDLPVNAIAFDPAWPAYLYVATDAGVFAATDGGAGGSSEAWQQLGTNLPNTTVFQVKLSATYPRKLVAATHGRGAWSIPAIVPPTPTITPTSTISPTFTVSPTPTPTSTPGYATAPGGKTAVLYPSPAHHGQPLCLALPAGDLGEYQLEVYDLAGEHVLSKHFGPYDNCLPIDALASGIYFGVLDGPGGKRLLKFAVL